MVCAPQTDRGSLTGEEAKGKEGKTMVREFVTELYRRDKLLAVVGWMNLALFVILLCIAPFDSRTVMGINPWIKPMKFAFSIAVYVWTVGWFLSYLPGPRWALRTVSRGASVAMLTEIACIVLQAARGTTSHYNVATPFDGAIFSTMGSMILANAFVAALLLVLFLIQPVGVNRVYLWGIRLGLLLLLLGNVEGFGMIRHGAHTVGLPDGGPGLPLVNWSTRAGDLRIAHLLALHAFQILPLAAYGLSRWKIDIPANRQLAYFFPFALAYLGVTALLFLQAVQGHPLIAL
jgi:hypothetical protein